MNFALFAQVGVHNLWCHWARKFQFSYPR